MKIVLSNIALDTPHGSEVWCWTVARELLRRHHTVSIISAKYGTIAREMERFGCRLICPNCQKDVNCDIAILNHANALSKHLSKLNPDHSVFITHGRHKPETPLSSARNVAVSREVANFWKSKMPIKFEVIPNPVAPEYFEIKTRKDKLLKNRKFVYELIKYPHNLYWGNHRHKMPGWMLRGIGMQPLNCDFAPLKTSPLGIIKQYKDIDLIFGTGRWIYDGMAAGMNCVVTDGKKTLGHITPSNYQSSQNFNMTARNPASVPFNPKVLDLILQNYDPERGAELKQIAMERHHVSVVVDRLLEV